MRYIRSFVVVFAIILSLTSAFPVYAADSYFSVAGCPADPATPCQTTGDGVNTNIPLSKTVQFVAATQAQLLGPRTIEWAGELEPLGDTYLIGRDKLTTYGNQVHTSADTDLDPAYLQSIERYDTSSKPASMTSRLCVYDPSSLALVGDIISSTTIISDPQEWITSHLKGSRQLASYTTRYTQEEQDFFLQPITIRQDAALPCGSHWTGETKTQNTMASQYKNIYGDSLVGNVLRTTIQIVASMIRIITHSDGSTSAEANPTVPSEIVGTEQHPWTGHDFALSAGAVTVSDLNASTYMSPEQKQKFYDAGGYINAMYRQEAGMPIDPTYTHKVNNEEPDQKWRETVTGSEPTAPNTHAFAARIEGAGDYMNCTIMPSFYQNTAVPGGECNTNWVLGASTTPGSTVAGGWNCDTSVPAQSVPGLNVEEAQYGVDHWFASCPNGTNNAWKQCMNDVIARAKNACVDPLFALAIWIHESGASNYQCSEAMHSGAKVQDFGININSIAENISEQLNRFVQLPSAYTGNCPDKTLQNFFSRFSVGHYTPSGHYLCYNELSVAEKKIVDDYISEIQYIYSLIAPGVSLPTWPGGC